MFNIYGIVYLVKNIWQRNCEKGTRPNSTFPPLDAISLSTAIWCSLNMDASLLTCEKLLLTREERKRRPPRNVKACADMRKPRTVSHIPTNQMRTCKVLVCMTRTLNAGKLSLILTVRAPCSKGNPFCRSSSKAIKEIRPFLARRPPVRPSLPFRGSFARQFRSISSRLVTPIKIPFCLIPGVFFSINL